MRDLTAVRFGGDRGRGVGITFQWATKMGPARLTDVMEVTEWNDRSNIRHRRS